MRMSVVRTAAPDILIRSAISAGKASWLATSTGPGNCAYCGPDAITRWAIRSHQATGTAAWRIAPGWRQNLIKENRHQERVSVPSIVIPKPGSPT